MGNNQPACAQTGLPFLECVQDTIYEGIAQNDFMQNTPSIMRDQYWNFLVNCTEKGQDPGINLACYNQFAFDVDWGNGMAWELAGNSNFAKVVPYADAVEPTTATGINDILMTWYVQTVNRLNYTCGADLLDDIWPEFYHMYNTPNGKLQVEAKLSKLAKEGKSVPPKCLAAIQTNYIPEVNAMYGILNIPDMSSAGTNATIGYAAPDSSSEQFWSLNHAADPTDLSHYMNKSIWATPYSTNFWGNPFWTTDERNLAFSKAIGHDFATGQDFYTEWAQAYVDQGWDVSGKVAGSYWDPDQHPGEVNPYNDPVFSGNLPFKVSYQVGTEPWHRITISSDSYGYANPCLNKPWLDSVMPYVGGLVAGGFGGIFVPGTYARVIAAITGGVAGYSIVSNIFGYEATVAWFGGDMTGTDTGADVLSVGIPCTLWQLIYDLNLASSEMQKPLIHFGGFLAAGAIGYTLIAPSLRIGLDVGGGAFILLSAPIAFLEEGITMLFNGCQKHRDYSDLVCDCEQANTKPLLAAALVQDIYGCTGNQAKLRLEAMHAAMTTGNWGTDPNDIGECDGNGHMSTPIACLSAGEFAYQEFRPEISQQAWGYWNDISHVVDIQNRSFLPPVDADKDCITKYGQFFRNDGTGNCMDYRAPVGKQGPGQFNWNSLDDQYQVAACNIL